MFRQRHSIALTAVTLFIASIVGDADGSTGERKKYLDKLVEDLRSDSVPWNARRATGEIVNLHGEDVLPVRERLIRALDSPDLQQRQVAAVCLTWYRGEVRIESPRKWPSRLTEVLVEALRSDSVAGSRGFPNANHALDLFYRMKEGLPVGRLRQVLADDDRQARYLAAVILANGLQGSVQPDVSAVLVQELKDDHITANAISAYTGLIQLGRENFERLVEGLEVEDWQQAAYLQFTATRLKVDWKAPRRFLDEWVAWAEKETHAGTLWKWYHENRISTYALIIHPDGETHVKSKNVSLRLKRFFSSSRYADDPGRRVDRLMSLHQSLKPDEASAGYRRVNAGGSLR